MGDSGTGDDGPAVRDLVVAPVCVGVGGRAGIGRSTVVDALAAALVGRGPVRVGELPPSNDPRTCGRHAGSAGLSSGGGAEPGAVPVDIGVHLVLGEASGSDLRAVEAQERRGVPVLIVRARADEWPAPRPVPGIAPGSASLAVGFPPGGASTGLGELVECLCAGVGRILAARADAQLDALQRAALEGPGREDAERLLRSPAARSLRATGQGCWAGAAQLGKDLSETALRETALREAGRLRAEANAERDPARRRRAVAWHRRFADLAVRSGGGMG